MISKFMPLHPRHLTPPVGVVAVRKIRIWLVLLSTLSVGCSQSSSKPELNEDDLYPVTLALNWYAEAEHGGFVYAVEEGLYEDVGLDVTIQQGGPGAASTVIRELAAGRVPFVISNADLVVMGRASGLPLVAVAAPLQQSPRCIMVHKAAGMKSLSDLTDVELAINDSRPFAMWMKKKLPLTNVTMVPYSGQVREFLIKPNFAQQAYVFSEPFLAQEGGGDPQTLMLSEIGFNPYGSLLVTTEKMIQQQPNVVQAMVTASVDGWNAYLDNPESTNAAIHRDNPEMSLKSLQFGSSAMKPLCEPPPELSALSMQEERWQTLINQIEEIEAIKAGVVVASECYDLQFLETKRPDEK